MVAAVEAAGIEEPENIPVEAAQIHQALVVVHRTLVVAVVGPDMDPQASEAVADIVVVA